MAKTAKSKKDPLVNPKSRASKRATSPSIDVDKSLREAPRATDATPILAKRSYGGITKSKKRTKPLTRGQRKRHEKGIAMAETVQGRMSKKVEDAVGRVKKRKERAGMWDDVNNKFDKLNGLGDEGGQENDDGWVDEDMEDNAIVVKPIPIEKLPMIGETKLVVVDRTATSAGSTKAEDDEVDKIT